MTDTALRRRLDSGQFAMTAEVVPPLSANADRLLANAGVLRGCVDAVNVTDGAGAKTTMSSFAAAAILAQNGIEPVLQVTCRDRNRIALAADLLGAAAQGIANLLPLFGDDPTHGDQPDATSVHDYNTLQLIKLARQMTTTGTLPSDRTISPAPDFFVGAADTPRKLSKSGAPPSLAAKVEAGAHFVQTQLCFDLELIKRYIDGLDHWGLLQQVSILIGLGPIASVRSARWMQANLWGVEIPDAVLKRLADAADERSEGQRICLELISALHELEGVAGVHIMAPALATTRVRELIDASGLR